jgi:hypothetical protein
MSRKLKFKPVITRVKLNPEQAVLMCECYSTGKKYLVGGTLGTSCSYNYSYGVKGTFYNFTTSGAPSS